MLEEAKKKPVVFDNDCQEMSSEMLSKFKRVNEKSSDPTLTPKISAKENNI